MKSILRISVLFFTFASTLIAGQQPFYDRTYESKILGEPRHFRIFLPSDYEISSKAYPVVYYFHGHSDRYTLEHYDQGKDTVPRIADFVASHSLIVVSVDGYLAKTYGGFYGGAPWDIMKGEGQYDFGAYFLELVNYIDGTYRTLTDRRHRATSGLSMGGFMSLYLSARYPDRVGSASAFNPGPEFYVGEPGQRVLWRPKDHTASHEHSMIRLIRASGDYISQYHEETREAFARNPMVDFEFRQDEYHRHAATSIEETLEFHLRAFSNSPLDNIPETWNYASPFHAFSVWGFQVESTGKNPGYICLEGISQGGLRVLTRQWAPDGPPIASRQITLTTDQHYQPGTSYKLLDFSLLSKELTSREIIADQQGRLHFTVDGAGHQIGIAGPGTGATAPVLLPLSARDRMICPPAREVQLPIRLFNPRGAALDKIKAELSSDNPTVEILQGSCTTGAIAPGGTADLSPQLKVRFTAGAGVLAPTRLELRVTYDGWQTVTYPINLLVIPEVLAVPAAIEILDGRTMTFKVFRQQGNQGGGALIDRTVTEGRGNGNGILEPGEEATVWVKMVQGMDPFDKNSWHRCRVYSDSAWLTESQLLEEDKQREWTGAQERTSLLTLSAKVPAGTAIPILLENESWSFYWTPDVRYGKEPLYQPYHRHTQHLHRQVLTVP
jgi:pimeloyl-ACP methyl ester carboxylesterase